MRLLHGAVAFFLAAQFIFLSGVTFPTARPSMLSCEDARRDAVARGASLLPLFNGRDTHRQPEVLAQAAVIIDAETGRVLYRKHAHDRRAPASTTKIMTGLLAVEATTGDERVITTTNAADMVGSSVMGLAPGMDVSVRDLVYGLMLPSGNDAALDLARFIGGGSEDAFIARMNERVEALHLADTHFVNPHGLDAEGHYSSAYDLAMIAREAMRNDRFREVVGAPLYDVGSAGWMLSNGNTLLSAYPGADGVKIGWTEHAGWTFVASAVRDGHRVIAAVMDTPDRDGDAAAMLDWAFASYRWTDLPGIAATALRAWLSSLPHWMRGVDHVCA